MSKPRGEDHYNWKGGMREHLGYVFIYNPDHPKSNGGSIKRAWLVAERVFGKPLPLRAVIHHVNGIRNDDRPSNLVVCENRSYHNIIHERQVALKACGNPNWRKCWICQKYDDPKNLYQKRNGSGEHHKCRRLYLNEWRKKTRERGDA